MYIDIFQFIYDLVFCFVLFFPPFALMLYINFEIIFYTLDNS